MYFLDYQVISSLVERSTVDLINSEKYIEKNSYKILYLGYLLGTFLSRSSVIYFKIPRIEILSYLQILNFLLYFSIAYFKWMGIIYQIPLCVYVGLLGGASFGNCFFLILDTKKLKKLNRELCVNFSNLFMNLAVIISSVIGLFVANYVITG